MSQLPKTVLISGSNPSVSIQVSTVDVQHFLDLGWKRSFQYALSRDWTALEILDLLPTVVLKETAREFGVDGFDAMTRAQLLLAVADVRGYLFNDTFNITSITDNGALDITINGHGFVYGSAGTNTVVAGPQSTVPTTVETLDDDRIHCVLDASTGHSGDVINISVTNNHGTYTLVGGYTIP